MGSLSIPIHAPSGRGGGGGRSFQFQRQQPVGPTPGQITALHNTYARTTPGVLGASMGGQGLTPESQWDAMFPNKADGSPRLSPPSPAGANRPIAPSQNPAMTAGVEKGAATPTVLSQPGTVAPASVTNAAGTGKTVALGTFGTGSSRVPTAADNAAAASKATPIMENGVQVGVGRAPGWQEQILKEHPEIGVAGSEGNKAYVSAYQDALKNKGAGQFDPVQLSHDTMAPIYQARADKQTASENAFGTGGPGAQAAADEIAGGAGSAADVARRASTATQQATQQAKRDASTPEPGSLPAIAGNVGGGLANAATAAGSAINNAGAAAARFVTGDRNTQAESMPQSPAQAAAAAAPTSFPGAQPGQGKAIAQNLFGGDQKTAGIDPTDWTSHLAAAHNAMATAHNAMVGAATGAGTGAQFGFGTAPAATTPAQYEPPAPTPAKIAADL
jgi:hypothetical protein